jgi:epoxyqueuosine reductase
MHNTLTYTTIVKQAASSLGFYAVGIAKAQPLHDDAVRLEKWLSKNYHGTMQYMEKYFDLRIDPTLLVPGAKSIITLLFNYYPEQAQVTDGIKISKYAYGQVDYHTIIKDKLNTLLHILKQNIGDIQGRGFVDSAPVLERSWAQRSGLGWIGKNGNLINKQQGSFFFIATLITDLILEPDAPMVKDYCGTCTACIDACPTQAILPNKTIDGSQCISYYTIELKDAIINSHKQFDNWAFGCDTCQDVCPWNRFSQANTEPALEPIPIILNLKTNEWQAMQEDAFKTIFKNSAIKRTKHSGLMRNIKFVLNK